MKASEVLRRHKMNPLIKASMAPFPSTLTYNAGITKYQGRYVMLFRNDYNFTREQIEAHRDGSGAWPKIKISLGLAYSKDGYSWEIQSKPLVIIPESDEFQRVYDPRLTVIDGVCYICFAADTAFGIRGGIARTEDFSKFELMSLSPPDNRNMVLFPERVNGNYVRLERPFPVYGRHNEEIFDVWYAESPDLCFWGKHKLLLDACKVPFAKGKIGPAAPPVKTKAGWLTSFHAVQIVSDHKLNSWHGDWDKIYSAGLILLDLENPSKIIGFCKEAVLLPQENYELEGFRGSVIFPGGMILEDSGEVKIYYGAADTVECVATAHVDDLIALCNSKY